jgi:hypothetical protein
MAVIISNAFGGAIFAVLAGCRFNKNNFGD